jgi:hypothetical protein
MKRDTDELKKNYTMLKSHTIRFCKGRQVVGAKKAPARKVADKQSNKDTEPDSEMMII